MDRYELDLRHPRIAWVKDNKTGQSALFTRATGEVFCGELRELPAAVQKLISPDAAGEVS